VATDPVPGRNRRIGRNELHAIAVVTATQAPFKQILDAIKCLLLLQVPLNFVAKRLFPQSFHRIINPGYPLFYHFFVAADPGFLRTPAAATPEGRLTGVGGCRIGNIKIVDRLQKEHRSSHTVTASTGLGESRADSYLSRGNQRERSAQRVPVRLQDTQQQPSLALGGQAGEAVKDDTGVNQPLAEHQLAEVLVGSQQQRTMRISHLQ
jgi:hypothetical protein